MYGTEKREKVRGVPYKMRAFVVPRRLIEGCRKNNMYSGTVDIFTAEVEDENETIQHTKQFDSFTSAIMWSRGMIARTVTGAYRILDTDTKTCLSSGRMQGEDLVSYDNKPSARETKVLGLETPIVEEDQVEALKKGEDEELEHAESIAKAIAKDHLKKDPNYYKSKDL